MLHNCLNITLFIIEFDAGDFIYFPDQLIFRVSLTNFNYDYLYNNYNLQPVLACWIKLFSMGE